MSVFVRNAMQANVGGLRVNVNRDSESTIGSHGTVV
jgi:hypothetical protein